MCETKYSRMDQGKFVETAFKKFEGVCGTKYSRMDQVKIVEDSL